MKQRVGFFVSIIFSYILLGCSVPSFGIGSNTTFARILLPALDSGYRNLHTRVIISKREYQAFLGSVERQREWDKKVQFAVKLEKANINFREENLLIYRYHTVDSKIHQSKITAAKDHNITVRLTETKQNIPTGKAQVFFYKVSKKIPSIQFRGKQSVVVIKNKHQASAAPRECIAWFDGCNHCIRSGLGKPLCTKRYCSKKGAFRCVKWQ